MFNLIYSPFLNQVTFGNALRTEQNQQALCGTSRWVIISIYYTGKKTDHVQFKQNVKSVDFNISRTKLILISFVVMNSVPSIESKLFSLSFILGISLYCLSITAYCNFRFYLFIYYFAIILKVFLFRAACFFVNNTEGLGKIDKNIVITS